MLSVGGLFDGCGLLAYGLHLAGLEHSWLCELDEWRQDILRQRFPGVPVYPDVRAVDARAARVDLVAGGFPCKGISSAGPRTGFGHPESALWREMHRVIGDLRPRYVLVENVADLLTLHDGDIMGEILGGLASLGYDAEWDCFPAAAFGAPHGRDRVFVTAVAHADSVAWEATFPRDRRSEAVAQPGTLERAKRFPGMATVADANSGRHSAELPDTKGGREVTGAAFRHAQAPPDTDLGLVQAGRHGSGTDGNQARAETPADPDVDGRSRLEGLPAGRDAVLGAERRDIDGRGSIDFGDYELAVRRWEAIFGRPSPEPLIRRVDDGGARRVERSRLSALGDGVLVQAGWLCGRRIVEYEAMRRAAA